ncbi:hypothetical protein ANCCAN_09439 [Ancylostoma caninum]|uniref:DUF5641 domain-containing protein n=1 Tax=Ancylostoma caninum TaxID=29170 RepID=A0A368GJI4_ANCCA|nr:hypothetical protein ANCCAN_09439 [Ancylostoma caninum]
MALKKTVRKHTIDLWTLGTLLFEIEATLNTRPITPVSTNPSGETYVLRPIDPINPNFRLGRLGEPNRIGNAYYDPSVSDSRELILSDYNTLRAKSELFWSIWRKEYLQALAERNNACLHGKQGARSTPKVGDVVLIHQDSTPRGSWPLGLIIHLNKSKDGYVRSVKVRTGKRNVLERSVNQLVPLEVAVVDEESTKKRSKSQAPTRTQPPRAAKRSKSK